MRRVALVFILVLFFVGCRSRPTPDVPGPTRVRVAVGGQTQLVYLPLTLAERLGYYADENLAVEIQDFPGGARALQSLMGGSADVVCGYYDHTVQMAAEGRVLKAFVAMLRYPGFIAVVAPSPKKTIGGIADLKGAMIGVSAPGSSTHFFINYLLAKQGMKPDDIGVTGIGAGASAVAAVERSQVDAGIVVEPTFTQLKRRLPDLRVLADTRSAEGVKQTFGVETYPAAVLYAPDAWLGANPDTGRRLARAIVRTLAWIRVHTPAEIAEKVPAAFRGDDPSAYVEALEHTLPMFSHDGRLDGAGSRLVREVLALSLERVRTAQIDLDRTYTNEVLTIR
jgi:NitT/TauT family transport system substrate-binding protein